MEDVSRLVGKISVPWQGNDYIVGPATIETWGVLQNHLIKEKRTRMIQSVLDLKGLISDQEFADLRRTAINEAGNVNALSRHDIGELMGSEDGATLLWWVLFEESYKGKFTRKQIRQMVADDAITEDMSVQIADQLQVAFGAGKSGNSDGQTEKTELQVEAAPSQA